jgi:hypothetical protein
MAYIYDLVDQWADAAVTFTGIKLNVTDTASAAASNLMDLQVGGASRFKITKSGQFSIGQGGSGQALLSTNAGTLDFSTNFAKTFVTGVVFLNGVNQSVVQVAGSLVLGSTGTSADAFFLRDAANTLAQRNGVNAQAFNIYNTYTDASNYERGFVKWTSNELQIGTQALGTGSTRDVKIFRGAATSMHFKSGAIDVSAQALQLLGGSYLAVQETSPPPAALANFARVFAEDDGAGKTRLMVQFGSGAAVQIAIEP